MLYARLFSLIALGITLLFARFAAASVFINEVLFDPSGSDTGLEKVELYNSGNSAVNMSGWQLYLDKAGYFTFPSGFELLPQSFSAVHLKMSGADNASNLYHAAASSSNMGNSSGSLALFTGEPRGKDTIADFMRYHKPGSSESKTWESAAVEAGLWRAGDFADITVFQEGFSLAFGADGVRGNGAAWSVSQLPTIGSANGSEAGDSGGEPASQQNTQPPLPVEAEDGLRSVSVVRSLKAYAGEDRTVFQGAEVEFRGIADGVDGKTLESGRFLWNFGDGTAKEGKMSVHVYYFPGAYHVSLNVSNGEYTGADYADVTVVRPDLILSEAKHGDRGFVELFNKTAYRLDLGGFYLYDGSVKFYFERETYIKPKSAMVIANSVSGLLSTPRVVSLHDAHGFLVDGGDFSGQLKIEESFERVSYDGNEFLKTQSPTPGVYTLSSKVAGVIPAAVEEAIGLARGGLGGPESGAEENAVSVSEAQDDAAVSADPAINEAAASALPAVSTQLFLAASIVIGIFAAAGFLFLRRG